MAVNHRLSFVTVKAYLTNAFGIGLSPATPKLNIWVPLIEPAMYQHRPVKQTSFLLASRTIGTNMLHILPVFGGGDAY